MNISKIITGISFINASISNIFSIAKISDNTNIVSISRTTASSLASINNNSSVSIADSPPLKAPIYFSELK